MVGFCSTIFMRCIVSDKYFQTKSKTLAYALNYIGYRYYKFNENDVIFYSFLTDDDFYNKLNELNKIKFS